MKKLYLLLLPVCWMYFLSCSKNNERPASPTTLPVLTTNPVDSINGKVAVSGGNVSSDGGSEIIQKGIVWSTAAAPTIDLSSKTNDGTGVGLFSNKLSGLKSNTKYYIRAYATNSIGTAYGNELSFTSSVTIGDTSRGRFVFYILQPGDFGYIKGETHGLIATKFDQTDLNGTQWLDSAYVLTAAIDSSIGSGKRNTDALVQVYGTRSDYAAGLARACRDGGYIDWSLPSKDELNLIYLNIGHGAPAPNTNIANMGSHPYWSSTQLNVWGAGTWAQFYNKPYLSDAYISTNYVRGIRYF